VYGVLLVEDRRQWDVLVAMGEQHRIGILDDLSEVDVLLQFFSQPESLNMSIF